MPTDLTASLKCSKWDRSKERLRKQHTWYSYKGEVNSSPILPEADAGAELVRAVDVDVGRSGSMLLGSLLDSSDCKWI